jgi:hypothetical protein
MHQGAEKIWQASEARTKLPSVVDGGRGFERQATDHQETHR